MWIRSLVVAIMFVTANAMSGCATAGQKSLLTENTTTPDTKANTFTAANADASENQPSRDISLTIYSAADPAGFDPQQFITGMSRGLFDGDIGRDVPGFGVVRDTRLLKLEKDFNTLSFTDVAQYIDPTSVSIVDLSVPVDAQEYSGIKVIQQKFVFDLVSPQKIFDRYVGRDVTINLNRGKGVIEPVTGTLLSSTGGSIILQTAKGIRVFQKDDDVQLGKLPDGLMTRPTLQWDVLSPAAGDRKVRTAYQTGGMTWRADYNLILNENDSLADLSAWVTLLNLSGAAYPNTELKLIAGDVQTFSPKRNDELEFELSSVLESDVTATASFVEKPFFEYHMYTLPRKVDIAQNATQQLVLFAPVNDVKVEKVLIYHALPDDPTWTHEESGDEGQLAEPQNNKLDIYIKFENKEDNKLGLPLPRGKVRAFKKKDDMLEFVGEGLIDHTAKNQEVLIHLGQSFDLTGKRTQVSYFIDDDKQAITETMKITLSSAKDVPQKVIIHENLNRYTPWHIKNWEVTVKSDDYEKIDSQTIHIPVTVPAGGKKEVTYTVRYNFIW